MSSVRHPIFARFLDRLSERGERVGQAEHRQELLTGLGGRVVELGAGNGINFSHYPPTVTELVAVEPEPYLRKHASVAAADAPVPVKVMDGLGGELPFEEAEFDAGVTSLVLCSVADPVAVLVDLLRVIRPGGELRFYEHVRAETPELMRFQGLVSRVWPFFGGGCHPDRDTGSAIERAGWEVESCRRFSFKPCVICAPVAPHILGVARRP